MSEEPMISRKTNTYAPFDASTLPASLRATFALLYNHRGQPVSRLRLMVQTEQTARALDNTLRRLSFAIPLSWRISNDDAADFGDQAEPTYTLHTPDRLPAPMFTGKPALPETAFAPQVVSIEDLKE